VERASRRPAEARFVDRRHRISTPTGNLTDSLAGRVRLRTINEKPACALLHSRSWSDRVGRPTPGGGVTFRGASTDPKHRPK